MHDNWFVWQLIKQYLDIVQKYLPLYVFFSAFVIFDRF